MQYVSETKLHVIGKTRAERATGQSSVPKTYVGYVCLQAGAIRTIMADATDSVRAFGVYDTATESDAFHADICQLVSGTQIGRSVRSRLFQLSKKTLRRPDTP